ncbi:endonuclease/exonuclease/phosphatase family protein [Paraglaciecola sp. L3A3]|uniref:endonuclease/exonuclease/phosphatase family protein n=1 Tax=Paraglaciecola sp. L3A3 TaxID=2686358 RepID=UPI001E3D6451|nr:endonuclease/exonuclease/phosphatase family protein [Paraglaciecola sp. L3A3]
MSLLIMTILLVVITLLPFVPSNHWLCRVWEFPRVQITCLAILSALGCMFGASGFLSLVLVVLNLAVAIYQIIWIVPYTPFVAKQVRTVNVFDSDCAIKIMNTNVLMTNHSADKLIALIKQNQPDIIVTLETDLWWQNALEVIHSDYPYRVSRPLDNLYGIHLYSKYVLEDVQVKDLVEQGVPSIHCYLKLKNQLKVKCHFLHPAPPSPTENTFSTPRDRELLLIARELKNTTEPTIVTGDLNDVAWSPTTRAFRKISGLQDPRIGRGMFNTFHAEYTFLRWPLDHIFHSQHFQLAKIQRLTSIDSDHFPLLSELVFVEKK